MASIVTNLLGGSVVDGVSKIIGLFKVDPTVALEKHVELEKIQLQMAADAAAEVERQVDQQVQVDLVEAQNKSLFIAGWRPAVGWTCAAIFAWGYFLRDFAVFFATLAHSDVARRLPQLNMSTPTQVLLAMLGIGTAVLRTIDKVNGVGNGH